MNQIQPISLIDDLEISGLDDYGLPNSWSLWHKLCYRLKETTRHWRIREWWYQAKCFLWKRYSTVKPRYLPHTWVDCTALLPHVMFEVLSRFKEQECSPGVVDWRHESAHKVSVNGVERLVIDEIEELYVWWNTYVHKEIPKLSDEKYAELKAYEDAHAVPDTPETERFIGPNFPTEAESEEYYHLLHVWSAVDDDIWEKDIQEKMIRLVNIYRSLWT